MTAKSLTGKTALITGASQGIGKAVASALGNKGAKLILTGRSLQRLEAAAGEMTPRTAPAPTLIQADLASSGDTEKLASQVTAHTRQLDILIHNAAQFRAASWRDTEPDELAELFQTNLFAPAQLTRDLLPLLEAAGGDIVFINSTIVSSNGAGAGQYAASKHALRSLADSLRAEIGPVGVRVLSVYPGRTATPMQAAIFRHEGRDYRPDELLQCADIAQAILNSLLLPNTAELTDLYLRPRLAN